MDLAGVLLAKGGLPSDVRVAVVTDTADAEGAFVVHEWLQVCLASGMRALLFNTVSTHRSAALRTAVTSGLLSIVDCTSLWYDSAALLTTLKSHVDAFVAGGESKPVCIAIESASPLLASLGSAGVEALMQQCAFAANKTKGNFVIVLPVDTDLAAESLSVVAGALHAADLVLQVRPMPSGYSPQINAHLSIITPVARPALKNIAGDFHVVLRPNANAQLYARGHAKGIL